MRPTITLAMFAAVLALTGRAQAATCDRACLQSTLDRYIDALARHDPSAIRVARDFRATENVRAVKLGYGLWRSAGAPTYRSEAVDPASGQAAALMVLPENGKPVIAFLRLKTDGRAIGEAETLIVRQGEGQRSNPEGLVGRSYVYERDIPPDRRASRQALKAAADAYLDAIYTSGTPDFVAPPLADDMDRIENGVSTSGRARPGPHRTVLESLRQGFGPPGARPTLKVTDRRYPVIDVQRGVIVVVGKMNLDMPPGAADMPGLHAVSNPHRKQILVEFFKMAGGKVRLIQALMYDLDDPAYQTTGWP